ncbi:sigma-70 family RNA polymerase sigma factor [Herbaspirillum lusitanum]|jgi:RNA polymerase sigma-70 factor (ECF subfamily)|uniref:Sigma-70 family RNA polymerase sigma factor n=1 Tax=Herbaspirillum lusitanum TaxID=213312 RepID=A0ABW9AET2_9BURK
MSVTENALRLEVGMLYTDHHDWLQQWLKRKLGDAAQAADLAQDTFLRLLTREELIAAREPRAFLTTVAQRLVFNHHRRQTLERAYLDALACLPPAQSPSPEQRALLLETLFEIDAMLDGLPLVVRRAFLLSQLDGMTQAEIATELDISLATVKRYLVKAAAQCYFSMSLP